MKKDYYSLRTPGSIGKCNKITIKARTTRAFAKWMLVPRHGGLYRWRENSLPIFLFQKLKEILTLYSRTILKVSKN